MRRLNPFWTFGPLILVLCACLLWAALPATDAFTGANGTTLPVHNDSWVYSTGADDWTLYNNAAYAGGTAQSLVRWTDDAFSANQYSQAVFSVNNGSTYGSGPAVRIATDNAVTGYYVSLGDYNDCTSGDACLFKVVAGTRTELDSAVLPAVGSVIKLSVIGTALSATDDTVEFLSATDSAIASGAAGMGVRTGGAGNVGWDDWQADDVAAATGRRKITTYTTILWQNQFSLRSFLSR